MPVLQFEKEVISMRISWKIRMYICIFLAVFHILGGMCSDVVEADLRYGSVINSTGEAIETCIRGVAKSVLLVGTDALNICESEVCFQGRIRMTRSRSFQGFEALIFIAWFLLMAYVCRHLLELSEILLISAMRNIIFYIHKQDGKKDAPVFF